MTERDAELEALANEEAGLAQRLRRADDARTLRSNPLLTELHQAAFERFVASEPGDKDARDDIYMMALGIRIVREALDDIVNDGTMAQAELDDVRARRDALKGDQ